jgi:carbamoyltransferase
MNSVANGKVTTKTPFKNIYIQPASADSGGALGAAFHVAQELEGKDKKFEMKHAYWGPAFKNDKIKSTIEAASSELEAKGCRVSRIDSEEELCLRTAQEIADGKVVGWFQGRMEWGARALGNRSILCDPRRSDMKDIMNAKIKRRESFRPFAPSILRESVSEWFEIDDNVPFMMKVYPILKEKRELIPAVTHVDGTGRLQSVSEENNKLYYKLIMAFKKITGVPMLLNTSFNENEPIVCRPEEALACFLRTEMDVLVLGHYQIVRNA